jgi:hypothetical protein
MHLKLSYKCKLELLKAKEAINSPTDVRPQALDFIHNKEKLKEFSQRSLLVFKNSLVPLSPNDREIFKFTKVENMKD